MVGLVLRPQPNANEIAIVDEFYRRLAVVERELPEDVRVQIGFDTSEFIRDSIAEVRQTLFIAGFLVCLTIFLFLRELRSTLIPILTIPIALIGTFFVLYLLNYSINTLTLLGLVLAIGLVVDDAIVVLENIYKRIEKGEEPEAAAIDGARRGWQTFRHVTWPLLWPTTFFILVVSVIYAFRAFEQMYVMTRGGPVGATTTLVYYIFDKAFKFGNMGQAAAVSVLMAVIVLGITWIQFRSRGEE